jgi:hypothetical protein
MTGAAGEIQGESAYLALEKQNKTKATVMTVTTINQLYLSVV